jgi:hypothetical protein
MGIENCSDAARDAVIYLNGFPFIKPSVPAFSGYLFPEKASLFRNSRNAAHPRLHRFERFPRFCVSRFRYCFH